MPWLLVSSPARQYIQWMMHGEDANKSTEQFPERVARSLSALGAVGQRIIVAVSGGADSVALLCALAIVRRSCKLELFAAHANHSLRGDESSADEEFVRTVCDRLSIPLIVRQLPVPLDASDRAEGIESAARRLRQHFFSSVALEIRSQSVATAHTRDDQAETVLHRIVRGTGLAGLAGIPAARELAPGVRLIRPLLDEHRSDVLQFLASIQQAHREDRSNRDLAFTRNRLRHEVLPYLAQHINPQVSDALVRLAAHAAEASRVIDRQVSRLLRRALVERNRNRVVLRASMFERAGAYLAGESLRRIWCDQAWPLQQVGQAELNRLFEVVAGRAQSLQLPEGVIASRQRQQLVLEYRPRDTAGESGESIRDSST